MRKIAITSAIAMALFITSCIKEAAVIPINSAASLNAIEAKPFTSSLLNAGVQQTPVDGSFTYHGFYLNKTSQTNSNSCK